MGINCNTFPNVVSIKNIMGNHKRLGYILRSFPVTSTERKAAISIKIETSLLLLLQSDYPSPWHTAYYYEHFI